jgi:transposase
MKHYVGIDIGSETCVAAVLATTNDASIPLLTFDNTVKGIREFEKWLVTKNNVSKSAVICMESCGVYAETLCYTLANHGWQIYVEPPHKVRRAMPVNGPKTDELDAQNIARYAIRFTDELHHWQPLPDSMEQVSTLLAMREQYTQQSTALQNQLHSFKRKHIRTKWAETMLARDIARTKEHIKKLDKEIRNLIDSDDSLKTLRKNIESVPGVGTTLAAYLMIVTECFRHGHNSKELCAHVGIAPLDHQSGKSIHRKARSRGFGHNPIRRLLYLGAMSAANNNKHFRDYYARKVSVGKNSHLVINNLENKILSTICAVVRTGSPYTANYLVAS